MLAYHDRWGEHSDKGGVYFSFSYDEGETWGYPTFIDSGAYPCLCKLSDESNEFLCTYYRSLSLLKGVFFSIPFPTGIRAMADSSSITVEWDHYRGKDAEAYEYHVYRSEKPDFALTQDTLVFSQRNIYSYHDKSVETGRTYYYRVGVYLDGEIAGRSWQVSAMAGD